MTEEPHVMHTYARLPVALERGQGCRVWDAQGKSWLDLLGGIAVNTLGHNHPGLVPALQEQISRLMHVSNYFHVPQQEELAHMLCTHAGMERAFFCNSGLEANEAALKIARRHGVQQGVARPVVVVCEHAFHGRSLATMTATGNPGIRSGFGPLPESDFVRVPPNDLAALQAATQGRQDIVAVLLEPIQGEGGLHPMCENYLQGVRRLCDARGWLLMLDEIQCGLGRTGKWFAHQWAEGVVPDVMTLAKGLASGIPVGAVLARGAAATVLQPGSHGSTFGGNPLAMRAGVETLRIMEADGLLQNAADVGQYLMGQLRAALAHLPGVLDIRGRGLMIGIELDRPCAALLGRGIQAGVLFSVTAGTVIRLVPPLILSRQEADEAVSLLCPLVAQFLSEPD